MSQKMEWDSILKDHLIYVGDYTRINTNYNRILHSFDHLGYIIAPMQVRFDDLSKNNLVCKTDV